MQYSKIISEHFSQPQNVGPMAGAQYLGEATNAACMDTLRLYLQVEGGRVIAATFQAEGCVPSIALGSFLTSWVMGKSISELSGTTALELEEAVGGLPRTKKHAAVLAAEALWNLRPNCAAR